LRRIPAQRIFVQDAVYLEKACPEHGNLGRVLLWKNHSKTYLDWNRPSRVAEKQDIGARHRADGCPYECGLCQNHQQQTCTAILEVTLHCNLSCSICFSASSGALPREPELSDIEKMLHSLWEMSGPCSLQLSGGEPTLRNDLPQIVSMARKIGFKHLQINTNGLRLAADPNYARALKEAGVSVFFLQFDGVNDRVYQRIRGFDLLDIKIKAIEICDTLKVGVILVPTLVKGINDDQIGSIIEFAKKCVPTVKGVHFQPMAYLGRYPKAPCNDDRMSLSDVLNAIEKQTGGELRVENLVPAG